MEFVLLIENESESGVYSQVHTIKFDASKQTTSQVRVTLGEWDHYGGIFNW